MSERLKLLENGQKRCGELPFKYQDSVALQSVAKQIGYLIELEQEAPAAAVKRPLFLMNYTRPTYKSTVQVSYFWAPGLLRDGDLKFRMY